MIPEALQDLPAAYDASAFEAEKGDLQVLAEALGHSFVYLPLLRVALTRGSWHRDHPFTGWPRRSRNLEFYGDAVLQLLATDVVWKRLPFATLGEFAKARTRIVCNASLGFAAGKFGLGRWIYMGRHESKAIGRGHQNVLADAAEAVLGAVFLDAQHAGQDPLAAARRSFERLIGPALDEIGTVRFHPKSVPKPGPKHVSKFTNKKLRQELEKSGLKLESGKFYMDPDEIGPEASLDPKSHLRQWAERQFQLAPVYVYTKFREAPHGTNWLVRVELRPPWRTEGWVLSEAWGTDRS